MKKVKALLYCTKSTPYLVKDECPYENEPIYFTHYKEPGSCGLTLNGNIVAKCDIETEEIRLSEYPYYDDCDIILFDTPTLTNDDLLYKSCLYENELNDYLINQKGYALHISNLEVFDNPKELYEYNTIKAPQNMQNAYKNNHSYVLISIRPEWLCKILNGEKTIEVRKKVLKKMIDNSI